MGINVRTKGQQGEREIAKILNIEVAGAHRKVGLPRLPTQDELFQRNQNQSAVGGSDLSNPLGLDIEVKRQEQLSVNAWWKQTLAAAARTGGIPVLMFRQNRKAWRICMLADLPLQALGEGGYSCLTGVKVEIDMNTFKDWFRGYYKKKINDRS